jgi:hypothetical protein
MGDDSAVRTRAACPVNAFGADDGVRFNGNRRKEKRSQRSDENCLHEIKPSVVGGFAPPCAAESSKAMTSWRANMNQLLVCRIRLRAPDFYAPMK